jgi:hypothetical protein
VGIDYCAGWSAGRETKTIADGFGIFGYRTPLNVAYHDALCDSRDLSPGTYIYHLETGTVSLSRTLVVIRSYN